MNIIIYQYCYHNHRNYFEMLDRIANTLDYYKEMNDIKRFSLNLKLFKDKTEILFVDIIPHFMLPEIYTFNFEESMKETEIFEKIIKQCSILLITILTQKKRW